MTDIDFRKGRWALATQTLYTNAWAAFLSWCAARELCPLPAAPQTIADYIRDRSRVQKVTGMQTYLNAVRAAHRLVRSTYDDPESDEARRYAMDTKNAVVLDALKEVRREKGTRSEPKQALPWKELQRIVAKVPENGLGLRDRAMMLLGFGAALRRSEVVALNRNDLRFSEEGVAILIRRSKTDQAGMGKVLRIPNNKRGPCAVQTLKKLMGNDPPSEEPLFLTRTGARCTGWDYALIIKRAVRRAGTDPARFSGHSMRRGYITTAFARGAPLDSIMEKSRHKTPAMAMHYREDSDAFDSAADKAVWG